MTVLTHALRPYLAAPCRVRGLSAQDERQVLFGVALLFLAGGAALVLHALSGVTAFQ